MRFKVFYGLGGGFGGAQEYEEEGLNLDSENEEDCKIVEESYRGMNFIIKI